MAALLLYFGLALMIFGTLYGFFVAARRCIYIQNSTTSDTKTMSVAAVKIGHLRKVWYLIMLGGLIITGTGIFLHL